MRPVVIVSNRGPLSFRATAAGGFEAVRGAGGLAGGLAPLVDDHSVMWIASALSAADRAVAGKVIAQTVGCTLSLLAHPPETLHRAYDVIGNEILWFVHHGLFDLAYQPRFDRAFRLGWDAYRAYNGAFADAVVESAPPNAAVLVQDYHMALLAPAVRERRRDVRLVHFSHTPFAGPERLSVLPDPYRTEMLAGMAAFDACGFHTPRWRDRFLASCGESGIRPPRTFVSALAPDPVGLREVAGSAPCEAWSTELERCFGRRRLIVRVDRMELSKNVLRGFAAFDELLERWPQYRGDVCFAAALYPSREKVAEYSEYRREITQLATRVNERWATPDWAPIVLYTDDDYPRSVALLKRYDVLLVNPVADGMNLVAKEGPLVNVCDGSLVLSTEAGAWDELGGASYCVHPCDVSGTAEALAAALEASAGERRNRAATLRALASARTPQDWLDDQLAAANHEVGPAIR